MKHTPVLLQQAIESLNVKPNGVYVDATVGEGGHLKKIIEQGGKVLGIEWDEDQYQRLKNTFQSRFNRDQNDKNVTLVNDNYANIEKITTDQEFFPVDGVLFDFGLSMRQIAESGRGFTYQNLHEPLDMRINNHIRVTASEIINNYSAQELYEIFSRFSEEFHSLSVAKSVVRARSIAPIQTTGGLIKAIKNALSLCTMRHIHGTDTYARIFQALRITVNDEFQAIEKGLKGALTVIKPGGRVVAISFHSLEDRIVKRFIHSHKQEIADDRLIKGNRAISFERSAKMRVIVKKGQLG